MGVVLLIVPTFNTSLPSLVRADPITVLDVTSLTKILPLAMLLLFVVDQLNVLLPDNAVPTSIGVLMFTENDENAGVKYSVAIKEITSSGFLPVEGIVSPFTYLPNVLPPDNTTGISFVNKNSEAFNFKSN